MRHERALWALALLLGALLRLPGLSGRPLDAGEAAHAWPAARAVSEGAVVADGITSAFLASSQAALFALAGPTTFLARLPAALCGLALLLVPLLAKDALGSVRAAALVVLLALDPTLVLVARSGSGASAALLAAALAAAALVRWNGAGRTDARHARAASVAASASLGLLLATGTEAWSFLPLVGLLAAALRPWRACAARTRDCAAAFGATFLLAATAGLWAVGWASAASASLTAWLEGWARAAEGGAIRRLLVGAPFTLALALAGIVHASRVAPRRAAALLAALAWAALLALRSPAPPAPLAAVLAIAAADGAASFVERARRIGLPAWLATAAALAAVAQLALAARPQMPDASIPSRPGLETLAADLERISVIQGREANEPPVLVLGERDDPSVRWALRGRRSVSHEPYRPAALPRPWPALVSPSSGTPAVPPRGYAGAPYVSATGRVDLWVPID